MKPVIEACVVMVLRMFWTLASLKDWICGSGTQADKLDPYAVQALDAIALGKRCRRGAPSTRARVY